MIEPAESPYLVPFDGSFQVSESPCDPSTGVIKRKAARDQIEVAQEALRDSQRMLYAQDSYSLLLVFQAMDAAGKDSTIRAVMSGIDPAGCQVFSFKRPSSRELDHDFLWRTSRCLPERGRIGIFNRSYYEEVLVVRVHPKILDVQRLPDRPDDETVWAQRYQSIRNHERHLARNGTVILKFWLNVSKEEQRQRFLSRIEEPRKNWKFEAGDVRERGHWDKYMESYEQMFNETSRPYAPWYAIPANSKPYMRVQVANIVLATMQKMNLAYPTLDSEEQTALQGFREQLENE